MSLRRSRCPLALGIMLLMVIAASGTPAALAADKRPDSDLLEFLGSVDAEGGDWRDYLENTDVGKVVAAKPGAAQPVKPVAPAKTPPPQPTPVNATPASPDHGESRK